MVFILCVSTDAFKFPTRTLIPLRLARHRTLQSREDGPRGTRLMTTKLINVREVFVASTPILAEQIEPCLHSMLRPLVHSVAEEHIPYVWKSLPIAFKEEIVYAEEEAPQIIENMMTDIKITLRASLTWKKWLWKR